MPDSNTTDEDEALHLQRELVYLWVGIFVGLVFGILIGSYL